MFSPHHAASRDGLLRRFGKLGDWYLRTCEAGGIALTQEPSCRAFQFDAGREIIAWLATGKPGRNCRERRRDGSRNAARANAPDGGRTGDSIKQRASGNGYTALSGYPAAKADIPELAHAKHLFVKTAARVNNRAGNSHQCTRRRERKMCDFWRPRWNGHALPPGGWRTDETYGTPSQRSPPGRG